MENCWGPQGAPGGLRGLSLLHLGAWNSAISLPAFWVKACPLSSSPFTSWWEQFSALFPDLFSVVN